MERRYSVLLLLVFSCLFITGYCIPAETIPPSGSNVAGFENEENITVFCAVFNDNRTLQLVTRWHRGDSLIPINVIPADPDFTITGDPVPGLALTFATNLTIVSLTADLDQMLLFCGIPGDERAATFTMRIYRPPSLQDLPEQIAVEGDPLTVDLEFMPEAFPFPQSVQWYKDGEAAANDTDRTLGYPNAVFDQVNRDDAGMYTLTATNNRLDNASVEIGTDSASFNLTVIFGPEFDDDIEGPSDAAVLQNDTVILVCGKNLIGFPNPDIEWRDNNGALISNGGRYTFSDSLDVVNLTISDTTANDTGNWSCNVSVTGPNGESTDIQLERIIELVVVVPPSAPFQVTADPAFIGPTFIRICWQIQGSALGTPPVSFFRIFVQPLNVNFTTDNGTVRDFKVTGLLPGTEYEFIVTAVSVSGQIEGESEPSSPRIGTTIVTVPAPVCDSAPVSEGGVITVTWTYAHTGGLNLTQVDVQYMEPTQDQFEGNETLDDPNQTSVSFTGLEAGSTYLFQITAYNADGSDNVTCPPVTHEIGIPRAPEIRDIAPSPGRVVLTVLTAEAGIDSSSPFFAFYVKVSNGVSTNYTFQFDGYLDNTEEELTIDDLEAGRYLFSVSSRNDFGASDFIGAEDLTTIEGRDRPEPTTSIVTPTESTTPTFITDPPEDQSSSDDNAAAIAGGIIGGFIAVVLIFLIILLIVYLVLKYKGAGSYKVEGGQRGGVKVEEVEIDIGSDLQGNANANNQKEELHYAELESFNKPPTVESPPPKPVEEPVEYAVIQPVAEPKPQGEDPGDKSQTSTTLV